MFDIFLFYQITDATQSFIPNLKGHLLGRLAGRAFDGDDYEYSLAELASVDIVHHRIYRHKVLRVNYTTYDMRRAQDSINPRTHPDILLLSHDDLDQEEEERHPYWYARVIGIFHAD